MSSPSNYTTLKGLVAATERVLKKRAKGQSRVDGMSMGMWLHNAAYCAETSFRAGQQIRDLIAKEAITRPQDLLSIHGTRGPGSIFGIPLPTRDYNIGDNVPGVGRVDDATESQLCIAGAWYHRSVFDEETNTHAAA